MNAVVSPFLQPAREWSPYQTAIYAYGDNSKPGKRLVIKATAGSGKSTTMVELIKNHLRGSHVSLAFNKSIKLELRARGVNADTFHGICFRPVLAAKGQREVDIDKVRNFIDANFSDEQHSHYAAFVNKLVGLAKNIGIGCLVEDTENVWVELADKHDIELEHERASFAEAIELSRYILAWSNSSDVCDFNDLLYFAVKDGIRLPKFDNVVVDEGQDTNAIQIAVIRKLMHNGSNLYVVGDEAQSIYGFRGADSDALDNIIQAFNAEQLPLTVSYRCALNIVNYAKKFGEIEAAPNAVEGIVRQAELNKAEIDNLIPGDLIVSRCTAPLIQAAYQLLKARKSPYVMGREIGAGLRSLVNKMNAEGIDALIKNLEEYTSREVEKAIAKNQEAKVEAIRDKTDCILFLIDELVETERTVPALVNVIEQLFANKADAITLSTVHRAKGLEANKVVWLGFDYKSKFARQQWQKKQERNLCFVAATRAKYELVMIPSPKKGAA